MQPDAQIAPLSRMRNDDVQKTIVVQIPERYSTGEHQAFRGQAAMGLESPLAPAVSGKQEETVRCIANATSGVTAHYQVQATVMIHIPQGDPVGV